MKKVLLITAGMAVLAGASQAQIVYNGGVYSENFDTLPSTGTTATWTDNSTLLGWYYARQAGAATSILVNNGAANTGALYSYGATGSSERALGSVSSGTPVVIFFGARLLNNTNQTFSSVTISFTQENWRNSTSVVNTSAFSAKVGATGLTDATGWTNETALDLVGPAPVAANGALDGNDPQNQVGRSATFAVNWAPGTDLWIRWMDNNDVGNDAGLAVDNLNFTAVPEPATLVALGLGAVAMIRRRKK